MEGLEPPRLAAPDPKSGAATNYATSGRNSPSNSNWFVKKERKFIDILELKKTFKMFNYWKLNNFIPLFKVVNSSQNPTFYLSTKTLGRKFVESNDGNWYRAGEKRDN